MAWLGHLMHWVASKALRALSIAGGAFAVLAFVFRAGGKQARTEAELDQAENYIETRKEIDDALSRDRDLSWYDRLRKARERR